MRARVGVPEIREILECKIQRISFYAELSLVGRIIYYDASGVLMPPWDGTGTPETDALRYEGRFLQVGGAENHPISPHVFCWPRWDMVRPPPPQMGTASGQIDVDDPNGMIFGQQMSEQSSAMRPFPLNTLMRCATAALSLAMEET